MCSAQWVCRDPGPVLARGMGSGEVRHGLADSAFTRRFLFFVFFPSLPRVARRRRADCAWPIPAGPVAGAARGARGAARGAGGAARGAGAGRREARRARGTRAGGRGGGGGGVGDGFRGAGGGGGAMVRPHALPAHRR